MSEQREAYQFSNVLAALVNLVFDDFAVESATLIPSPRPAQFVQVVRVGGQDNWFTDEAIVTFYVWGESWPDAWDLTARVRQRVMSLHSLGGLPVYDRRTVGGPAEAPDPLTGDPRYQFTHALRVRGFNAA